MNTYRIGKLRIQTDTGRQRGRWRGRLVKASWGKGAGYIGGWTVCLAFNCVSPYNDGYRRSAYVPRLLQLVATRNANRVPYTSH